MAIKINGANHFAISVADLEETIRWYSDIFGFTVIDRSVIPGAGIKVAHMQGVGFILEIFEAPGAAPLPEDRRIPNRDLMTHGNKHMSFGVPDGPKAKEGLEKLGVEIAMVAEVDGTYGVFIRDNTGNLIEIFEEKGDSPFNQHRN
ncbi:MAG: VOC family protein [Clostridiales bacterium]|nr:VOC family protein [Clostridiales bacterium]